MENSWYSFDLPIGWVFVALLFAALAAIVLYTKKGMPWSRNANLFLGFLRLASIFLIGLLLLNPLFKRTTTTIDKPILILAVDNSESIALRMNADSIAQLQSWITNTSNTLTEKYEVTTYTLSGNLEDSLGFNEKTTDLSKMLQGIASAYEGERVSGVVLLSDGIVNQGSLPQYSNYAFPLYTVGLGDTIAPKDFAIEEVRSNDIAYQGNKFPIRVQLNQNGYTDVDVQVSISEAGKMLANQNIKLEKGVADVRFELEAKEAGLKHLIVKITQLDGESTYLNNEHHLYISIIKGREKILILAPAPHPDISAIRSVLAQAPNYESDLYIAGLSKGSIDKKYDVIIEHNAFSGVKYPEVQSSSYWYILGSRSIPRVNQQLSYFKVLPRGRQTDNVRPIYQSVFSKFHLTKENLEVMEQYPPITVPFAEYKMSGPRRYS